MNSNNDKNLGIAEQKDFTANVSNTIGEDGSKLDSDLHDDSIINIKVNELSNLAQKLKSKIEGKNTSDETNKLLITNNNPHTCGVCGQVLKHWSSYKVSRIYIILFTIVVKNPR